MIAMAWIAALAWIVGTLALAALVFGLIMLGAWIDNRSEDRRAARECERRRRETGGV